MSTSSYEEFVPVPRRARLDFPLELLAPKGFKPSVPATWPRVNGRLEFVKGKLWYMPPCGDDQQDVGVSLASVLENWATSTDGFVAGGNEAGMVLAGEVRGADGAIWRRSQLPRHNTGGYRRVAPVLAAEVAGEDEDEELLRDKARWYLEHGVKVVWLLLPKSREVVVIERRRQRRFRGAERLAPCSDLPGLEPEVARFFRQLR